MKPQAVRHSRVVNVAADRDPYITIGATMNSNDYWSFGRDNLFPYAVAALNRKAAAHRGILNSKARYIAGKGLTCDDKVAALVDWIKSCNAFGENLREPISRLVFDKKAFGNCFIELVTNSRRSFLNFYHHDATKCRVSKDTKELTKDKKAILLHPNWREAGANKTGRKEVAIYPTFSDTGDGYLHSMIHLKDYEPEFENYGVMDWIAGLNVGAIAYKTDKWNISRLDNSFNSSGVLVVAGEFETPEDYAEFSEEFKREFTGEGKQGKILMLAQQPGKDPDAGTRFVPISQGTDGDWKDLHALSTGDLVIAHGWFRSLSGIADNTGFDTQRILNEYEIALNTVILDEQEKVLSVIRRVLMDILRIDATSLAFVNRPPMTAKPNYMMIWEARKADGLPYDEKDPAQQIFLANITKAQTITLQ